MIRFAIALLLGGCHVIFALEDKAPVDAPGEQIVFDVRSDDAAILEDGRVCWDPTLVVHDEDGDSRKDGCDNCPAVENPEQMNDDFDDLGNECDPHPGAIDTIVYWQGFKDPGSDAGWNPYVGYGTWKVESDAYRQTATDEAAASAVLSGSFTNATVEVVMNGITVPGIFESGSAGAYVWSTSEIPTQGAPDGVLCIERRATTDTMEIRRVGTVSGTTGIVTGARANKTYLRFTSKHAGNPSEVECIVARGTAPRMPKVALEDSGTGYVTLYTGATAANFHSVLVSVTP